MGPSDVDFIEAELGWRAEETEKTEAVGDGGGCGSGVAATTVSFDLDGAACRGRWTDRGTAALSCSSVTRDEARDDAEELRWKEGRGFDRSLDV